MYTKNIKASLYCMLFMAGGYTMASQTPVDQKVNAEQNQSCLSRYMPTFFKKWPHNAEQYLNNKQVIAAYRACIKKTQARLEPWFERIEYSDAVQYSLFAPSPRDPYLQNRFYCLNNNLGAAMPVCSWFKETPLKNCGALLAEDCIWAKELKMGYDGHNPATNHKAFAALETLYNLQHSSK